jgi:hypothetical protein
MDLYMTAETVNKNLVNPGLNPGTNIEEFLAMSYSPTPLPEEYHRRWKALLLCSRWEQVWPFRYCHQKLFYIIYIKLIIFINKLFVVSLVYSVKC